MAKCLRCGAGAEWLQGDVKPDANVAVNTELLKALEDVYQRTLSAFDGDEEYMLREAGSAAELRAARAAIAQARGNDHA